MFYVLRVVRFLMPLNVRYHRMLDLEAFRSLMYRGLLEAEDFTTITADHQEKSVLKIDKIRSAREFFGDFESYPVCLRHF